MNTMVSSYQFEGQEAMEQLIGVWVGEVSEMLALAKAKEMEAVKEFISRQKDFWRRPYMKRPSTNLRSSILIGTTNQPKFLSDKTGNRRFLPVQVNSSADDLYKNEEEIREYINQCWAEAKVRYDKGEMLPHENRSLLSSIKKAQEDALEDDWRLGRMIDYLNGRMPGDYVCIQEMRASALYPEQTIRENLKESREIGLMLGRMKGWKEAETKQRPTNARGLGAQRCWMKL